MRGNGVDKAVGTDGGRAIDLNLDAEIDVGIAHHDRLAFEISAAEHPQIEQRGRHDGRDDGGSRNRQKVKPCSCSNGWQQNGIFVGRARGFGDGAPFGADILAVMDGEDDVGIAGVDGEKHVVIRRKPRRRR